MKTKPRTSKKAAVRAKQKKAYAVMSVNRPDAILTWKEHMEARILFPIITKADYEKALKIAREMVPDNRLDKKGVAYLDALGTLIEAYEKKHYSIDTDYISPLDALKLLLEENGMNYSDLGRLLGQRELGSKIIRGERQLSKAHIITLSEHFSVEPGLFLRPGV